MSRNPRGIDAHAGPRRAGGNGRPGSCLQNTFSLGAAAGVVALCHSPSIWILRGSPKGLSFVHTNKPDAEAKSTMHVLSYGRCHGAAPQLPVVCQGSPELLACLFGVTVCDFATGFLAYLIARTRSQRSRTRPQSRNRQLNWTISTTRAARVARKLLASMEGAWWDCSIQQRAALPGNGMRFVSIPILPAEHAFLRSLANPSHASHARKLPNFQGTISFLRQECKRPGLAPKASRCRRLSSSGQPAPTSCYHYSLPLSNIETASSWRQLNPLRDDVGAFVPTHRIPPPCCLLTSVPSATQLLFPAAFSVDSPLSAAPVTGHFFSLLGFLLWQKGVPGSLTHPTLTV